ncbi:hypothetical protein [Chryseobacterium sp. Leaf394]|uniref:XAC2610-related protein n=1 Tax=Chryseobacterium sp. Leaf394 TaxID=1736361 RepID=UPI0006F6E533|nr:hypothetical protein [Chryseobacterium sp. Leaf394]KQS93579.1 hypothetical protein ASG21_00985 [Chryseobacterium sp. Leaf394]
MKFSLLLFLLFFSDTFFGQTKILTVKCDSVYDKKGYSVSLEFNPKQTVTDDDKTNAVFSFSKLNNGKKTVIHQEKLFSKSKNIEFIDFNGDRIKDILVENTSDARSNLTYHLFIFDIKNQKLQKIRGFNQIKNPNYIKKYNLIDCYVLSGRNWTKFYKIKGSSIYDFGYILQDGEDEEGKDLNYDKNYQQTLTKILQSENNKK